MGERTPKKPYRVADLKLEGVVLGQEVRIPAHSLMNSDGSVWTTEIDGRIKERECESATGYVRARSIGGVISAYVKCDTCYKVYT